MPRELAIYFGDVFTQPTKQNRSVVTDVGEKGPLFGAAQILDETPNQEVLALQGSHSLADIQEVVGRWELNRVLEATKRSSLYQSVVGSGGDIQPMLDAIVQASQKPPRILTE